MRNHLRTLRWSAWLGWQIQCNWTDPWLFAIYVVVKPVAASLLLICMYWAAGRVTQVPEGYLSFLYVSNACYLLVGAVAFRMTWAVISDREHYGMLKYVYVSPGALGPHLVGRGLAGTLEAVLGVLVTLAIGLLLFPELRLALTEPGVSWGWLVVYLLLGVVFLLALGLLLAGAVLNTARHGMFLSEGVAGILYLLSGTVFPLQVLPSWVQPLSLALPTTYWLEGMRRALIGRSSLPPPLEDLGQAGLAVFLGGTSLLLGIAAVLFFRWGERRAWRLGKFDETTGF
jgi:ABC-2 type transport system permease protein